MEVNLVKVDESIWTPERIKDHLNGLLQKDVLFTKTGRDPTAAYQGIQVDEVKPLERPSGGSPVTRYTVKTTSYEPPLVAAGSVQGIPYKEQPSKKQVEEAIRGSFAKGAGGSAPGRLQVSDPFPQVATVGKRVASSLQADALVAIFISFLGIAFYLALRFELNYGLAGG